MRVHEIVEALEVTPSPITDRQGKPIGYNVVDSDSGEVKQRFTGGDAESKAKNSAATQNRAATASAASNAKLDPEKPKKDNEIKTLAQKKKDLEDGFAQRKSKLRKFVENFLKSNAIVRPLIAVLSVDKFVKNVDEFMIAYGLSGCNLNSNVVKEKQLQIVDDLTGAVIALAAAGLATATMASFVTWVAGMLGGTGVGIIPGAITLVGGTVLAMFVGKVLQMTSVAQWVANKIADYLLTRKFIKAVSPIVFGVDNPCTESAMADFDEQKKIMFENSNAPSISSLKKDVISAFKKDDEMKKLYKVAKKKAQEKSIG